ncbi:RNA 2',3'-cyclic phosphodiesterase [Coralliovum pocilloporae]|uniref:RNA 2',3'-cyclic phosphodiesterase n=1 Tax=Coralliovum pocilloporae TaxID=3066369 RepID=UPI00330709F3
MPRLFTGIEVPTEIASLLTMMRGGLPGARWIDPEHYHITLRFIGDIEDRTADDVASALDEICPPSFNLKINCLGAFGSRKPHCIWAGVEKSDDLTELQADQERLLQRMGLVPERRKYCPHITLARLRGTSHDHVADYLNTRSLLSELSFPVERFVLFSARASTGGGPYLVEADYPLL